MLPAAFLASAVGFQTQSRSFVPALDFATRPVAEWRRLLDSDELGARAAWCLYYADDRSLPTLDAMRDALATPTAPAAHLPLDAILTSWGAQFDELPASAFMLEGKLVEPDALIPGPRGSATGEDSKLLGMLSSEDLDVAFPAALALLARDVEPHAALRRMADALDAGRPFDVPTGQWILEHARDGWGIELGARIRNDVAKGRGDGASVVRRVAHLVQFPDAAVGAIDALVELADASLPDSATAEKLVRPVSGPDPYSHSTFHRRLRHPPSDDVRRSDALVRFYGTRVHRAAELGRIDLAVLAEIEAHLPLFPGIAAAVEPGLVTLLGKQVEAKAELLRVLGHVRSSAPEVRTAWIETVRAWSDFTIPGMQRFPCRASFDDETRATLLEAMQSAPSTSVFENVLLFSGEVDADRSNLARCFLDHLGKQAGAWSFLPSNGFRGLVDEPFELPESLRRNGDDFELQNGRALRVNRLALACATRQARGEDTRRDEAAIAQMIALPYTFDGAEGPVDYVQWGLWHARKPGLHSEPIVRVAFARLVEADWDCHKEIAQVYFENAELTIEQQVELARLTSYRPASEWRGLNIENERFGGRGKGKVALERSATLRRLLYGGNTRVLEELARITRLAERDLDYLLAVLTRGPVRSRDWALWLVEQESIDAPRVRDAVRRRTSDVDPGVSRRAKRLLEGKGW
jgi:hypothetical protein